MFGSLFDEEGAGAAASPPPPSSRQLNKNEMTSSAAAAKTTTTTTTRQQQQLGCPPPAARMKCGFSGLSNQGATCYLNSLLQTLFLTPEFRERLFQLLENELGKLQDRNNPTSKVRVIPLHLQHLFAQLLLCKRECLSTAELTESFGWTNNEALQQQHDVQELSRILFSAVEESLVGTSGEDLIQTLYRGTVVNQIICSECGKISERVEDFLDLTLAVTSNSLEAGLHKSYCELEIMDGNNKYRCECCQKLVCANKGSKLRTLPPILSFSLLRFSYNFRKMERLKETGKFSFPMTLDMSAFSERSDGSDELLYELFSVVIHRGGAHGGHYHAYIRDVDSLGIWCSEEENAAAKSVQNGVLQSKNKAANSLTEVEFMESDSPLQMLISLLEKENTYGTTIDKLCQDQTVYSILSLTRATNANIVKLTGVSWNKQFKRRHGSIVSFVRRNNSFAFNQDTQWVSLQRSFSPDKKENLGDGKLHDKQHLASLPGEVETTQKTSNGPVSKSSPPPGHCWFDFDDAKIRPIRETAMEKTFSGKESAYMLFYRKKSLRRPDEAFRNPLYCIPDSIVEEIHIENQKLDQEREEFGFLLNETMLDIHFASSYKYEGGALKPKEDTCYFMLLTVDRRKTVGELKQAIQEIGGEMVSPPIHLHTLKDLPAGAHLYDEITGEDDKRLEDLHIENGSKLFVWDGKKVQDKCIPTGSSCEPIQLTVIYGNPLQLTRGFARDLPMSNFKALVSDLTHIPADTMVIKKLVQKGSDMKAVKLDTKLDSQSLDKLKLKNGDQIIIEDQRMTCSRLTESTIAKRNKLFVQLEARCKEKTSEGKWPSTIIETDKDTLLREIKLTAMSNLGLDDLQGGGRLRVEQETGSLKSLLRDCSKVGELCLKDGDLLVLESGPAPRENEITVTFTPGDPKSDHPDLELIVDKDKTVGDCLAAMIQEAKFSDNNWHLRKTTWCGEAACVLSDTDATLHQCNITDGDHLLLQEGKLPPEGFLRLPVWLYATTDRQAKTSEGDSVISWITAGFMSLVAGQGQKQCEPLQLGMVDISKEDTLMDLRQYIITLPLVVKFGIPSPASIRLRLVEGGRLTTVLRGDNQTLWKLKLNSCSEIGIQILEQEEHLKQNQYLLHIKQHVPDTRSYSSGFDAVWDTSNGVTTHSLKLMIARYLSVPAERLVIAKHFWRKFDWMVLQDKFGNPKKRKKGILKGSLHSLPFRIQDGDVIGVKDQQIEKGNIYDFSTEEDDMGKEQLKKASEEKQKQRQEGLRTKKSTRGHSVKTLHPEVGLTIRVDKFT